TFTFEPGSSIAECYHDQGSDLALVMGILDLPLTDPRFKSALDLYRSFGIGIEFLTESFAESCHPNSIRVDAVMKSGSKFSAVADSTGGGGLLFRYVDGWEVDITGDSYYLTVTSEDASLYAVLSPLGYVCARERGGVYFFLLKSPVPIAESLLSDLRGDSRILSVRYALPVFFPICGEPLFSSGAEMVSYALDNGMSLADAALEYESKLLCMPKDVLNSEMDRRLAVMEAAVKLGLSEESPGMLLLHPTAKKIMDAEREGKLALGGIHTRAAARAMAAMQVNSGQGIVCAAPTGGSAGVLPGVLVTMLEDMKIPRDAVVRSMWAAGAAGWVLAVRGT
ncbi:MAG: L-serine ammonia-lyase, iron-sulfur-dependent, subunit alpha, partial [Synergistaceae bacterium]